MAAATAGQLATLLDRVAGGTLRVNVEATVSLGRAHEAFKALAGGIVTVTFMPGYG